MTITLTINDEQQSALTDVVAKRNATNGTAITEEQHLTEILDAEILRYVASAYDEAVRQLGEAAKVLPYADRSALIAQVAAMIT